jgi:N-dimethylarginine dimethylaminohydrolase
MVFGMATAGLGVIYPAGMGYHSVRYLLKKGIELIEIPLEEVQNYACNLLAVRPGRVILSAGNPYTREQLEKRGVEVIEMEFEGGRVSGRGPVCSTLPLIRDPGPSI